MFKPVTVALVLMLVACGKNQAQTPMYSPGKPMSYPVDARSALESLGAQMLKNCETSDQAIETSCEARMEALVTSCVSGPGVLESPDQYEEVAKDYLGCVMPFPICHGIEVKSKSQLNRHCGIDPEKSFKPKPPRGST